MMHLGDITKISGFDAPPVDVVIGGSPCQDLSVAGKRAGLAGARSGLYMEQVRIVREMRERDRAAGRTGIDVRPRFMVWENVPGAFSSNKGRDFAAVLEEVIRIAEPQAPAVDVPDKGWPTWGGYRDVDGGWSVAWRVLDAQYWGVPQRRRRIALVADFAGASAHEILFNHNGVQGHPAPCGTPGQGAAEDAARGTGGAVCYGISAYESNAMKSSNPKSGVYEADTSRTLDVSGGNNVPLTYQMRGFGDYVESGVGSTLKQRDYKDAVELVCCPDGCAVRRLTPLECERLQGYPDGWTDIGDWTDGKGRTRKTSDAARYKALGNSIALPPWRWVLKRISAEYERNATMASLFDGIGGFPLIWEALNGRGSCLWASEIEEFPIAVTRLRFGGDAP